MSCRWFINSAHKGRRFEHEIIHLLKAAGFSVTRGAGSKGEWRGQKVDLIFSKETDHTTYTVVLMGGIQCKAEKLKVAKNMAEVKERSGKTNMKVPE